MGALNVFWDSEHINISDKVKIHLVIPINLLLWGYQTWALTKVLINNLEVFLVRCLTRILKIRWDDVREQRIRNSHVRKKCLNIETVENIISKRRLRNDIQVRTNNTNVCFSNEKDRWTSRISLYDITFLTILINSNVDTVGSLNSWTHISFDESRWTELVHKLESTQADWDDNDGKNNEPEANSDWNKFIPSSPPPFQSSSNYSSTPPSCYF